MGTLSALGLAALAFALLGATGEGRASDLRSMYDNVVLERWKPRYAHNIDAMLAESIVPALTAEERRRYRKVQLRYPHHDPQGRRFFRFSSAGEHDIVIPVFVVKFLDDLAIAGAWAAQNRGRTRRTVEEYMALLKYRKPEEFPGRRYPTPLAGVGITEKVLEDRRVDRAAQALLKSQVAFLLAREVAELYLLNALLPSEVSNASAEKRAPVKPINSDLFALEVLRRLGVPPLNVCFYARAELHYVPTAFDLQALPGAALLVGPLPELLYLHGSQLRRDLALRMVRGGQDFLRFERDKTSSGAAIEQCARDLIEADEAVLSAGAQKQIRDRAISVKLGAPL